MYCKYCGSQISNDSVFCSICGKKQASETASSLPQFKDPSGYKPENRITQKYWVSKKTIAREILTNLKFLVFTAAICIAVYSYLRFSYYESIIEETMIEWKGWPADIQTNPRTLMVVPYNILTKGVLVGMDLKAYMTRQADEYAEKLAYQFFVYIFIAVIGIRYLVLGIRWVVITSK